MQNPSGITSFSGAAAQFDTERILRKIANPLEARSLPKGTVVGDLHGGLTFTDSIAAVLESRSVGGWQEVRTSSGDVWTIIVLSR